MNRPRPNKSHAGEHTTAGPPGGLGAVLRHDLPATSTLDTLANESRGSYRSTWSSFAINPRLLQVGDNVLAVEVHGAAVHLELVHAG